ncbi:hypothetical protein NUU61_001088 [Penicillium alfredii]|uniref:IgE-binding protein n=1 Tax=Penicillium alfredii TaxID=1506179 RepID=A0A9W9GAT4_9EURO|nr:uncharacterized protein NUU61_001088 [Penicillium alfredii]KAJ5115329.1 hypothetical protein NUU61_001088 [Penicillium alfredii]
MKLAFTTLLLPLLAAAAPAPTATTQPAATSTPTPNPSFRVLALRSASQIHYFRMTARENKIWLGNQTEAFCPENVQPCPPGKETIFAPGGTAMDVAVPGGQQVYVDPTGALRYTQAHSAAIPPGSARGPFTYQTHPGNTANHFYNFTGWGANGFMACPAKNSQWQVFANVQNATVPLGDRKACLPFHALADPYKGAAAAWQYS